MTSNHSSSAALISDLKSVLSQASSNPYPTIPNPPDCKRRASVALIIRVRPTFPDIPPPAPPNVETAEVGTSRVEQQLEAFFGQDWVQRGDPEVLFIKRAARKGDRFTSHVAFPGGKRDASDEDDRFTAIRETVEEVGLDLNAEHALSVGNLSQEIITAEWGKKPFMVLCPYIFLLTRFDVPPLRLQPTEVQSAHWVPIRALLAPSLKDWEVSDIADRLTGSRPWLVRIVLRALLGQMMYPATRLVPSESVYCSSTPDFIPKSNPASTAAKLQQLASTLTLSDTATSSDRNRPLLLWGLTYGIVNEFLDMRPSYDLISAWRWPTFSAPDVRLVTWLMRAGFKKEKLETVRPVSRTPPSIIDEGLGTVDHSDEQQKKKQEEMQLAPHLAKASAVGFMLRGYFQLIRRAVFLTLLARLGLGVVLGIFVRRRLLLKARAAAARI